MSTLNITTMKKNYIDIAKQKLQLHKTSGEASNLSIFQVAELIDVISGRKDHENLSNSFMFSLIGLN